MRRRKKLVAAACIGMGLVAAFFFMQAQQPRFRGHTLTHWLLRSQLDAAWTNINYTHDLQAALDHFGTNATPSLLKWIRYERPQWRDTLYQKAPVSLEDFVIAKAELRADACEAAFIYLGTNAAAALGELTKMAYDTNATETADRAMTALAAIGPEGIRTLLAIAQETNNANCAQAMIHFGQHSRQNNSEFDRLLAKSPLRPFRIAALAQLMRETNPPEIRGAAALVMSQHIDFPALALPPLIHCATNDTSDGIRASAVAALYQFGTNALPALTNALTDPAPRVRVAASNAIQYIVNPHLQFPRLNEYR